MPAIKLSGLLLLPIVLAGWGSTSGKYLLHKSMLTLLQLLATTVVIAGSFGYITTGYAAYPVAWSGPLREESIDKSTTIMESKASTIAWARYAYSGQLDSLKINAAPQDWLPEWSKSLNGKRMLGYLLVTVITTFSSFRIPRLTLWRAPLIALTAFWICAILVFPPDPRFYVGPAFLTIYLCATWLFRDDLFGVYNNKEAARVYLASVILIVTLTGIWRKSEVEALQFPTHTMGESTELHTKGFYRSRGNRLIRRGEKALCWDAPPPCTP